MVIVLPEPPTVAESEQEIRMNEAQDLISNRPVENFLVPCVVNDKTQLSEHKRQESSIAKFRPRILKPFDQQEGANEQDQVESIFRT